MSDHADNEVTEDAFAELVARVGELADIVRQTLSHEVLSASITQAIRPVVAALAMSERERGSHTIH